MEKTDRLVLSNFAKDDGELEALTDSDNPGAFSCAIQVQAMSLQLVREGSVNALQTNGIQ